MNRKGQPYIVVVGGANVDIGGRSFAPLIPGDSNPGVVSVSLGGVGRNIAHNLSLLSMDVRFLTALGDDPSARLLTDSCGELKIDLSRALRVPGGKTSTYLFLSNPDGDMALALSDMALCDRISPEYLASQEPLLQGARLVIADANIPTASLAWLADHVSVPIFADPVSVRKAEKLRLVLNRLHTLKPNRAEAEFLSGIRILDEASLLRAARVLLDTGLQRIFLSLGARGVLAADRHQALLFPCAPARPVSTTGAGDAFMAALAWAESEDLSLAEAARAAVSSAALAIESDEAVNPDLSLDALRCRIAAHPELMPRELHFA